MLRQGETFDGTYNKSKHIPFFEDYTTVDLLPDMKDLGYDFDGMLKRNDISVCYDDYFNDGHYFVSRNNYNSNIFSPFDGDLGTATLYGTIEFDESSMRIDFVAHASLYGGDFGAVSYENDKFDIQLKSSGDHYTMRLPYTTVIYPQGAEMVKLTITADKSSTHRFKIGLRNNNGMLIETKQIYFHHFYPKDCDKWW